MDQFQSSRSVNNKKWRKKAQPHQFLRQLDPRVEGANSWQNNTEYAKIQSPDEDDWLKNWNAKMKAQKAAGVKSDVISNTPNPQRTRSLEEIIDWWKSNNPYMNGSGLSNQPLPTNLEGGNDERKSNVLGMGPAD